MLLGSGHSFFYMSYAIVMTRTANKMIQCSAPLVIDSFSSDDLL